MAEDITPLPNLQTIARLLGGRVNGDQVQCPGPGHSAEDRSLSVKPDANAPEGFLTHSFSGDDPIVCRDLVRQKLGLPVFKPNGKERFTEDDITRAVMAAAQARAPKSKPTVTYDYKDGDGTRLYQVLRYDNPKTFRQRRPDGNGGWIWKLEDRRVPYRYPDLVKFPDATIFVCEGEKDADRVASLGHVATTVASGKWTDDCIQALAGRHVLILVDNDATGEKKAQEAATLLHGVADTVRIVCLPDLPEGGDVSDWLDADPRRASKLADVCFDAPPWEPSAQSEPNPIEKKEPSEKPKSIVALNYFCDLKEAAPKLWLIKNVIARGETSSWVAPPGFGKSALLTDISIHGASAISWRGYRIKEQFGVLYFALERVDLVKRRLIAHRLRDNLPIDLPIAVFGRVIDLMARGCVENILAAIKQAEDRFSREIGLVVIDTYAKGIAAGGGDESAAKDQNAALANLRRVIDKNSVHIATVGHTGKDESKGERGSNAKLADVDLQVQLSGDRIKTAIVKKANDQAEGPLTSFRLEPYDFAPDEDGDPFRTFIMSGEIIETAEATRRPLTAKQQLAIEALAEAVLAHGVNLPASDGFPAGLKAVTADQWRDELYRRSVLDPDVKNPRARFSEIRDQLAAKHLVGVRDGRVWLAKNEGSPK